MKALEYGAVEIIEKPRLGTKRQIKESCAKICDIVKAASLVRVKRSNKNRKSVYKTNGRCHYYKTSQKTNI